MPPQLIAAARALFAIPALAVLVAYLAAFQGPLQFESNATLWSMLFLCAVVNYFWEIPIGIKPSAIWT